MRHLVLLGAALLAWPAAAHAQMRNDIQGFGGLTVGTSTFGSALSPTFGGRVDVGLTDHLQLIGEALVAAINAGDSYQVNQVRVGIGFRF